LLGVLGLLRILRRSLLRIIGSLARLLPERTLAERLPNRLAYAAGLHAGLAHTDSILRGIPDKFEEQVFLGLVVNHDRGLIDLAADTDDVAADDVGSVAEGRRCGSQTGWIRTEGHAAGARGPSRSGIAG